MPGIDYEKGNTIKKPASEKRDNLLGPGVRPTTLERRRLVAEMWNRHGATVEETAEALGVRVSTVANDRAWLRKQWVESITDETTEIIAREVAKLDKQEAELWEAWEQSKMDKVSITESGSGDNKYVRKTTSTSKPNPKYMELIIKCQTRRASLLGLDKNHLFSDGQFNFAEFVEAAYEAASGSKLKEEEKKELAEVIPMKQDANGEFIPVIEEDEEKNEEEE